MQDQLEDANKLLEDSEILSENLNKKKASVKAESQKSEKLPQQDEKDKNSENKEDINELLEDLNSKHNQLINHFSPRKESLREEHIEQLNPDVSFYY